MIKYLILIAAASLLSAAVCVTVEVVQAGALGGDWTMEQVNSSDPVMNATVEEFLRNGEMPDEFEKRQQDLALMDLMLMKQACKGASNKKSPWIVEERLCSMLRRYEVVRSSVEAIEAVLASGDTVRPSSSQGEIRRAKAFVALGCNYKEQARLWYEMQIMLGTGALKTRQR